ncbi:restriction endonuclease [bacterium]|nr:restriction endonuclease [bacterium]
MNITIAILIILLFIYLSVKAISILLCLKKKSAEALENLGLIDEAIIEYKKELQLDPDNHQKKFKLAQLLISKKSFKDANNLLENILKFNNQQSFKNEMKIYEHLYDLSKKLNRKNNEFKYLNKLITFDPDNVHLELRLSEFFIGNKQLKESITVLDRIIKQNQDYLDEALFRKGMVMIESDKMVNIGIEMVKKALLINPNHSEANNAMGFVNIKDNPALAIDYFQKASKSTEDITVKIENILMICYVNSLQYRWSEITEILENYKIYIDRINILDRTHMLFALATSAYFSGDEENSSDYWVKLLKIDFGFVELYDFSKSLDKKLARTKLLQAWNKLFENRKIPKISERFEDCKLSGLLAKPDISELSKLFNRWIQSTGQVKNFTSNSKSTKKSTTFVTNSTDLSELSNYEFCNTIRKVVEIMEYPVEHEFRFGAGFEAIIKDKTSKVLLLSRPWAGIIGEIQIDQLITYINKRKYKNGMIITCGKYSPKALNIAHKFRIRLIDSDELDKYLFQLQQ